MNKLTEKLIAGGRMPSDLFHGGWIDAGVVITTWGHAEFCKPIRLWTERLGRKRRSAPRTLDLLGNLIQERALENTLQTRPSKSVVAKLGRWPTAGLVD